MQKTKEDIIHNKRFEANLFRGEKRHELLRQDFRNAELSEFSNVVLLVFDKYALRRHKYICKNNSHSMIKSVSKAIILGPSKSRREADGPHSLYSKQ